MAVKEILRYPHPILTTPTTWVDPQDPVLLSLAEDLRDTLSAAPGRAALAANQIGVPYRVFMSHWTQLNTAHGNVFLNPYFTPTSDRREELKEGCLSFPGQEVAVVRWARVLFYYKVPGDLEEHEVELEGFQARLVQHEIEHLDGKSFIDQLPEKKRARIINRVKGVM